MSSTSTPFKKVSIVTGGSRGIGAELSALLARQGHAVIVNYAGNKAAAEHVVAGIRDAGGQAIAVQGDVSRSVDMRGLFDAAVAQFGRVDVLVNNAGILIQSRIEDFREEDYDRQFDINVKGTLNGLREAATRLSRGGRVVNVSSSLTLRMTPTYGLYAATKGAVQQLTRVFAAEMGPKGIAVNAVLPGPTDTELFNEGKTEGMVAGLVGMTPLGRLGRVDDIARVIAFLASDEAGWVTGQLIPVNGGLA